MEKNNLKMIAVAGNPNSGKSSIFNELTGLSQPVANYSGVTVEFASGICKVGGDKFNVVDLPGTYSLTAYSQEEIVSRDFLLNENPDAILVVLDASNLERNLYFLVQILELKRPVVVALNMVDVAERKGWTINCEKMSECLGIKVVSTIAVKNQGINELKEVLSEMLKNPIQPKELQYGHEIEAALESLKKDLKNCSLVKKKKYDLDYLAVKLLLDDSEVVQNIQAQEDGVAIFSAIKNAKKMIKTHSNEESSTAMTEARYAIANGVMRECLLLSEKKKLDLTDKIDRIVCNRFFGPIFMVGIIYLLFMTVFNLAEEIEWIPLFNGEFVTPHGAIEMFFEHIANLVNESAFFGEMTKSLLVDGIIGGVGGVLGFTPLIFFIFLFVAFLEDSGYIARIAFILDRVLRTFGLEGKSILALIVSGGFGAGCAVPGIMATRTLRDEKDRLVTILVAPMMNCGAKMPVYAMLVGAFFSEGKAEMMLLIWAISWIIALCSAFCLRKFVIKGTSTPFIMELPVYHLPTIKGVTLHTFNRTWDYIKKAGTILLAMSIVLWALMAFPRSESTESSVQLENSFAGRIGTSLQPISQFAGFDWRDNIALIGGFAAKEVVVQTLGTAYAMSDENYEENLGVALSESKDWSKHKALAMMIFVMIYAPCIATLAVIYRETKSWKWTLFSTAYSTILAFILAIIIFQVGSILA